MKFLAIDTSGKHLTVLAYRDGTPEITYMSDCALKHSVVLMDEIDGTLRRAHMSVQDCDFFAVVVGPGSFTGIRIGISTVKGLCLSCGKPALAVTSFDCAAYTEPRTKTLAVSDAGRGEWYVCGYSDGVVLSPCILKKEEALALRTEGYELRSAEALEGVSRIDPAAGLLCAVLEKSGELCPAEGLTALYLRKSSAEENRK